MCHKNNTTKERKGKHLDYSERLSIERWWNRDKRTKVEIAELLDRTEKTIRNEIHTYHLSTQRLENSVKIKISNRNYYVNVRNIVKFTDLKRDVVYYTLSDKLLQYINESKKKVRPDNRNRKTK